MGSSRPTGRIRRIRTGSSSLDRTGSRSSRTGNRQRDANHSRRIRASRGSTLSNRVNTHRRSSRTVHPARDSTGNRRSGLRNRLP